MKNNHQKDDPYKACYRGVAS